MAEIKRLKEKRSNLTIFEITGKVSPWDIFRFLESNGQDGDVSRTLFDFRGASLSHLSPKEIKSEVKKAKKFSRPGIKTAFVFSNPIDFSIWKMISKRVSKEGYDSDIKGFYNLYLAKDWLLF